MSGQDINPFANPEDVNPFAEQAISASSNSQKNKKETVEEFNPFAVQNEPSTQPIPIQHQTPRSPTTTPQSQTNIQPANSKPISPQPKSPATIEPSWMSPAAQPGDTPGFKSYGATTDEMQKKQEELDRKAAELDRKEAELRRRAAHGDGNNNFPPLPKWCCIGPCFYHDISLDIPMDHQRTCRMVFFSWQLYVLTLFLNVLSALAGAVEGYVDTPMLFGISLLYFILFPMMSFVCWYRPLYKALKGNSSFNFFLFFFVFFCQTVLMFIYALGINSMGTCGWVNASTIAKAGNHAVSALFFVTAGLFTMLFLIYLYLLRRVHQIFRSSGATMQKAQKELAEEMASNKAVQKAAVDTASAGIRGDP